MLVTVTSRTTIMRFFRCRKLCTQCRLVATSLFIYRIESHEMFVRQSYMSMIGSPTFCVHDWNMAKTNSPNSVEYAHFDALKKFITPNSRLLFLLLFCDDCCRRFVCAQFSSSFFGDDFLWVPIVAQFSKFVYSFLQLFTIAFIFLFVAAFYKPSIYTFSCRFQPASDDNSFSKDNNRLLLDHHLPYCYLFKLEFRSNKSD